MKKEFGFLQLFADPENAGELTPPTDTKVFTQEEINKIVQDRVKREKDALEKIHNEELVKLSEKVNNLQKDKDFKDLSAEERAKKERELEVEKYNAETQKLKDKIAQLERESRNSDILSEYNKDSLPCSNDFVPLVPLIANIDDAQERATAYAALKLLVQNVEAKVKKELFKNDIPNGSNGVNENNPFTTGNYTAMAQAIKADKSAAKELCKKSGSWDKYSNMF